MFGLNYTDRAVHHARGSHRHRGGLGSRNQEILKKAITEHGQGLRCQRGRRRVLRPEARLPPCRTASAVPGSAAPSSWISSCPSGSNLEYTGEDGEKHRPVMIHRVVFGSIERFIGVITEHFAGAFPLWLTPVQVKVHARYRPRRTNTPRGLTAEAGGRGHPRRGPTAATRRWATRSAKPRCRRSPTCWSWATGICESGTVSVRTRKGEDLGAMTMDAFLSKCLSEIASKSKDI